MGKNEEMWMDELELDSWKSTRIGVAGGHSSEDARASQVKKLSQTKLNLMLLSAAAAGDSVAVASALAEGAQPNARTRAEPRYTAFSLAITKGHDALSVELLKAGSRPAPHRYGRADSSRFDQEAAAGVFSKELTDEIGGEVLGLFATHAKDFSLFKQARDLCRPGESDEGLLARAIGKQRYDLALAGAKAGAKMTRNAWSKGESRLSWQHSGIMGHAYRSSIIELIRMPRAREQMDPKICSLLYRCALVGEDVELASTLLDAGLRPNREWGLEQLVRFHYAVPQGSIPLLVLAAVLDKPMMFAFLRACPPVVEAARRFKLDPGYLLPVPVGKLMELRDLGVDIEGRDADGMALTHLWADGDSEPRDGWATLAKRVPSLFDARDTQGRTGAELMAAKLDQGEKDKFLASLSRIESREIRKELGPKPKDTPVAKKMRL